MIPVEDAKRIAAILTHKYGKEIRAKGFQSLDSNDIYNEAFVQALQQKSKQLAYIVADRAAFRLICRKISATSRHSYGELDKRERLETEKRPESEEVMRTLDLKEALSNLSIHERELIFHRVVMKDSIATTAGVLGESKETIARREHFLFLDLARKLKDWRTEK